MIAWHAMHLSIILLTVSSITGSKIFSRRSCFVFTSPWLPLCDMRLASSPGPITAFQCLTQKIGRARYVTCFTSRHAHVIFNDRERPLPTSDCMTGHLNHKIITIIRMTWQV